MNNKGFTLIELLAIILLLAVISTIGTYVVSSYIESARIKSDEILWENIKTASKEYADECTSGVSSLDSSDCSGTSNGNKYTFNVTLKKLANLGFLNVSSSQNKKGEEAIKVLNSKGKNINKCKITISRQVNTSTYKVTYTISSENNSNCKTLKKKNSTF